jgi:hypothetical protein
MELLFAHVSLRFNYASDILQVLQYCLLDHALMIVASGQVDIDGEAEGAHSVDDGWSKKFMFRERIAPDHISVLSKVFPQDVLDLKGLKVTTSYRVQK